MKGYRAVPARLTSGYRHRQLGIMGLEHDPQLFRLLDDQERLVPIAPEGLLLSAKLAELLQVRPFQAINIGFAVLIAFGVVYNMARIWLAERGREMATLRVLGFTRREISAILIGELAVLTIAAIPPGLLMGSALGWMVSAGLQTEMYRIPLVITRATFGLAIVVVLVAALMSALVVRRRMDRLDLIAVLKSKE